MILIFAEILQSERGSQTSLATQVSIQSQAEQVNSLMEDAMQDSHTDDKEPEEDLEASSAAAEELLENTEEFSFPDDCNRPPAKPSSDDEEGFCILGEDPGSGIIVNTSVL